MFDMWWSSPKWPLYFYGKIVTIENVTNIRGKKTVNIENFTNIRGKKR